MDRTLFDNLRVIRREHESRTGCADICEGPDGSMCIRLRLNTPECQRKYLEQAGSAGPIRIEQGVLEVLYPCQDGATFQSWLYERKPGLGQRRDACLSVAAQCIQDGIPPCILEASADAGNLRFREDGASLQYLPDWMRWTAKSTQASAVRAVARLFQQILTEDISFWQQKWMPDELKMICIRARQEDYLDWSQLQRDVAALPENYPSIRAVIENAVRRIKAVLYRFAEPAACAVVALLLIAALLSLANVLREWKFERENTWPGMDTVGDQELRRE